MVKASDDRLQTRHVALGQQRSEAATAFAQARTELFAFTASTAANDRRRFALVALALLSARLTAGSLRSCCGTSRPSWRTCRASSRTRSRCGVLMAVGPCMVCSHRRGRSTALCMHRSSNHAPQLRPPDLQLDVWRPSRGQPNTQPMTTTTTMTMLSTSCMRPPRRLSPAGTPQPRHGAVVRVARLMPCSLHRATTARRTTTRRTRQRWCTGEC